MWLGSTWTLVVTGDDTQFPSQLTVMITKMRQNAVNQTWEGFNLLWCDDLCQNRVPQNHPNAPVYHS